MEWGTEAASPAAMLDIIPACAPQLQLGGEQEEMSTWKQICRISHIRKS